MSKILKDIIDLAKTIKDTQEDKELMEEDLDFLINRIENFPRYFNSIITMEIRIEMLNLDWREQNLVNTGRI